MLVNNELIKRNCVSCPKGEVKRKQATTDIADNDICHFILWKKCCKSQHKTFKPSRK